MGVDVWKEGSSGTINETLTCSFSKSYTRRKPFSLMVSRSIGLLGVLALGDDDDDGGGGGWDVRA